MYRFLLALVVCFLPACLRADTYAVLPFFNASKTDSLNWIGDSIAESIREALASEGVMTIDREGRGEVFRRLSMRPYALLTRASVIKVGEALDVEHVIYGQFELRPVPDTAKSRGSLQISARVLDLKLLRGGPEFGETGALEDLATLQRHLAWQTLRFVSADAAPSESEFRDKHPAVRVDAVENYVRGLLASRPEEKERYFQQAVHLDAGYSQAYYQLGRLQWQKKEYKSAEESLRKVAAADVHYREANFLLGLCRYYTSDFVGARAAFQLVARSVPLDAVYNNLGVVEARTDPAAALQDLRRAVEGDNSDTTYQFNFGYLLWKQGDFQNASRHFQAVLERTPEDADATLLLSRCVRQSGPHKGETRLEGLERLKTDYEESAYWQLKAVLQPVKH